MTAQRPLACAALLALATPRCASFEASAQAYAQKGRHELATVFFAAHYRGNQDHESARVALLGSVHNAVSSLRVDYQKHLEAGRSDAALATAIRVEELLSFAYDLGLEELDPASGAMMVAEARAKAARLAVEKVDRAETAGKSQRELMPLLRAAMAFNPDDSELVARYQRAQESNRFYVTLTTDCPSKTGPTCRMLADELLSRVSQERREFVEFVSADSRRQNAEMVIRLTRDTSDTLWKSVKKGKATGKVERKNRFRETVVDAKGKKLYDKVQAVYEIFERTTQAKLEAQVQMRSLGPHPSLLFEAAPQSHKTQKRSYYVWNGDERALGRIISYGTDRTPPPACETLVRRGVVELADSIAKKLLAKLEAS